MKRQPTATGVIPACFSWDYNSHGLDFRTLTTTDCTPIVAESNGVASSWRSDGTGVKDVEIVMSKTIPPMPCERVKAIREGLGLTQVELAEWLRLSSNGKYAVSRWELGRTDCPGPVSVALEAFEAGWRPGQLSWPLPGDPDAIRVMEELEKAVLQAQEHVRNIRRTQGV